ncbi:MAG: right-handed parallel beta-helix repeat-containing protein [Polyangiaceae bacterium]
MRKKILASLFALAALFEATGALASDYSVSPNGNDGAAGTAAAPWATIQHAADVMQPGDSVTVADGSYIGFWMKNRQGDAQHRFTFRSQNALGAKITAPSPSGNDPNDSVQLVSVSFATIDGFDVTGAPRAGISIRTFGDETGADTTDDIVQNCRSHDNGAGVTTGRHDGIFTGFAQNVLIQNNEIDHNAEHGVYVSNSADNPIVRGNKSHDNLANGLQINADGSSGGDGVISNWLMEDNIVYGNGGASAINLDGATFGILRNNLVYGNAKGGVALFMGDANEASHDNVVVGNTVYDPAGTRFGVQIDDGADNNALFDNVFWSASTGMEIGSVNNFNHDYNIVSSYSGGSAGAHESSADPTQLFVSASAGDYHPGPALMGKGTATFDGATAPAVDLDGNARPQAGVCDIGCYQHGGSSTSTSPDAGSSTGTTSSGVGTGSGAGTGLATGTGSGSPGTGAASGSSTGSSLPGTGAASGSSTGSSSPGTGAASGSATSTGSSTGSGAADGAAGPKSASDAGLPSPAMVGSADSSNGTVAEASTPVAGDASTDEGGQAAALNWGAENSQSGGGCSTSSSPSGPGGAVLLSIALVGACRRRR